MRRALFFILLIRTGCVPLFSQQNISCSEFFSILDTCNNAVVLDVRIYEEFVKDRIPGAVYAGEKEVLLDLVKDFDKDIPLLIYCEYGDRSETVMKILKKEGFSNLYHLKKGYEEWRKEGFPVDQIPIEK
jgi:hydroxyacylglutathione hydrolase